MDYEAPAIQTFDEMEVIGEAPESAGTHIQGSQIYVNGA